MNQPDPLPWGGIGDDSTSRGDLRRLRAAEKLAGLPVHPAAAAAAQPRGARFHNTACSNNIAPGAAASRTPTSSWTAASFEELFTGTRAAFTAAVVQRSIRRDGR